MTTIIKSIAEIKEWEQAIKGGPGSGRKPEGGSTTTSGGTGKLKDHKAIISKLKDELASLEHWQKQHEAKMRKFNLSRYDNKVTPHDKKMMQEQLAEISSKVYAKFMELKKAKEGTKKIN